jgi:dienelactone hydrolase
MKSLLAIFLLSLAVQVSAKDVELSFEKSLVLVPGIEKAQTIDTIKLDKPYPVVIYLHGCTGIAEWHDAGWGRALAQEGFVFIVLDSFARPGRLSNCDPNRKTGSNAFPRAHEYRQQEISYAYDRLQQLSWVDKKNMFLMGHSEGGTAVAIYPKTGFRGHIISAWTCTFRGEATLDGIKSNKEIPILVVAASRDVWRAGNRWTDGKCSDRAEGYKLKQIDLDGTIHATLNYPEAKPAVIGFVKELLIP